MVNLNDNRKYFFKKNSHTKRVEFSVIGKIVGKNKKIIDLGCGDGTLMKLLQKNSNLCKGMEISQSGVDVCKNHGLNVVKGRIDKNLPYDNKEFDIAICNVTLHMVMYPEILINEMMRISKKQIITFPNFAFIVNRVQLMFGGISPRWSLFGYKWYSTGHIHQLSIKDFKQYCSVNNIKIVSEYHIFPKPAEKTLLKLPIIGLLLKKMSNLLATMAIFVIKS